MRRKMKLLTGVVSGKFYKKGRPKKLRRPFVYLLLQLFKLVKQGSETNLF